MTERRLQDALCEMLCTLIEGRDDEDPDADFAGIEGAMTFEDLGVLTTNMGVVVRFESGDEFQVTIVRSR